ncbi:hypothetical protein GY45DRAFT_674611 [Cubamyces sp. BRFM 1775]|nr:hypothetical protein GY45DRAFT_674611 [Cubamyces sp. BRFM 1775]
MLATVPVDIWRIIFAYACTDGGRTGIALSSVSKLIRALSASYRFHSVRLATTGGIGKFLACYRAVMAAAAAEEIDTPRVRHLLLSFLPRETDVIWLEGAVCFRDVHSFEEVKDIWNRRFTELTTDLLSLVAPHLETLTVLQSPDISLPMVQCSLPVLRELTLLADDRIFIRLPDEHPNFGGWPEPSDTTFYPPCLGPLDLEAIATNPSFPALKRLHLVDGGYKRLPWDTTLPVWAKLAPQLASLRISCAQEPLLRAVQRVLQAPDPIFPTLQVLDIQLASDDPRLTALAAAISCSVGTGTTKSQDVRKEILVGAHDARSWPQRLVQDWQDRM